MFINLCQKLPVSLGIVKHSLTLILKSHFDLIVADDKGVNNRNWVCAVENFGYDNMNCGVGGYVAWEGSTTSLNDSL